MTKLISAEFAKHVKVPKRDGGLKLSRVLICSAEQVEVEVDYEARMLRCPGAVTAKGGVKHDWELPFECVTTMLVERVKPPVFVKKAG